MESAKTIGIHFPIFATAIVRRRGNAAASIWVVVSVIGPESVNSQMRGSSEGGSFVEIGRGIVVDLFFQISLPRNTSPDVMTANWLSRHPQWYTMVDFAPWIFVV